MIGKFIDILQQRLFVFGSEYCGSKLLGAKMGVAKSGIQREICLSCFLLNGGNCWTGYNENEASQIMTLFGKLVLIWL